MDVDSSEVLFGRVVLKSHIPMQEVVTEGIYHPHILVGGPIGLVQNHG